MKLATLDPAQHAIRWRAPTDQAIKAANGIAAAYLALGALPMLAWAIRTGTLLPPLLHGIALGLALWVVTAGTRVPRAVRDWMPLALGPFFYIELRWLIPGLARPHADARVLAWEQSLFGGTPSSTLALRWPWLPLSELLHLCYASYYLLVLVPPLLLYLAGRRADYARTLLALVTVYAVCFTTYLVFPVDGPRYLMGPAAAPDGPIRHAVLALLASGSSRGTAFPSSHVAASVVASLCALRTDPRIGIPVALLTAGLTVGTVYGGFHYAVDALVGLLVGLGCVVGTALLWRHWSAQGAQSATAA
jgi:membrane-associated phospholipid phosphatase